MSRPRIVVIRGGAIGDFILTLPVLAALRGQFPACELEVIGYPQVVALATAGGCVDAVRPIEARAMAGFFARGGPLDPQLSEYFEGAALIVSFLYDPDGIFRENVGRCTKGQFVQGPHRPDETAGLHATRVFLSPLERLAILDADPVPRLRMGKAAAGGKVGPALALHPGSGSARKNWPAGHWIRLVELLRAETDLALMVVGGEAEGEVLDRFEARFPGSELRVLRGLPLPELAVELAACSAYVGHDSGITHLAAALGLPGIVLWGPTNEAVWRPSCERMELLRAEGGLAKLSVPAVLGAIVNLVAGLDHAKSQPGG